MSKSTLEHLELFAKLTPKNPKFGAARKAIVQSIKKDASFSFDDYLAFLVKQDDPKWAKTYSSILDILVKKQCKSAMKTGFDADFYFVSHMDKAELAAINKILLQLIQKALKQTKSPSHVACEAIFLTMLKFSGIYARNAVGMKVPEFDKAYGRVPLLTIAIYEDEENDLYPIDFVLRLMQIILVFFSEKFLAGFLKTMCKRTTEDYFELEVFWLENYEFLQQFASLPLGKAIGYLIKTHQPTFSALSFKSLRYNQYQLETPPEAGDPFDDEDDEDYDEVAGIFDA